MNDVEIMIGSLFRGGCFLCYLIFPKKASPQKEAVKYSGRRWDAESDKPCFRSAIISFTTIAKLFLRLSLT